MVKSIIGIDLGTTLIKAGVFSAGGQSLAQFEAPYPTSYGSAGHIEQDPGDWCRLIDTALSTFEQEGYLDDVTQGALTSQVNTHVFVDNNGTPLMPAILWQDQRAVAEATELNDKISDAQKIAWFGAPIPFDASHPLARMLWVKRHCSDIWAKTHKVLLPKDYALLHLTGEWATDPLSNIGTVGLSGDYVTELLDLVGGAQERMAPIRGLTEIVGKTKSGIEMASATMDGWVGLLGTGVCREGAFAYLSGTSEVIGAAASCVTNEPGVVVFPGAGGLKIHAGPTQSGGASQKWFSDLTGIEIPKLIDLVSSTNRRMPTPLFLPQLAGERAPLWNPDLRGAFLGIEAGMVRTDFIRGIYEGVAFSARHILEAIERSTALISDTITCGGGGFRSDPWGQIRADILGKRLERLRVNQPAVVGAAVIALASAQSNQDLSEVQQLFAQTETIWEPNPANRAFYDDMFGIYLDAVNSNEDIGRRIARLGVAD